MKIPKQCVYLFIVNNKDTNDEQISHVAGSIVNIV